MDLQTLNNTSTWDWPEDADRLILKVLRERNAPVGERVLAAALAVDGTIMNDNTAALLLAILQDSSEPEELRCKAANSLGFAFEYYEDAMKFDDPAPIISEERFHELQQRLRDIYQDTHTPKKVRRKVLEAVVRAPMDWHNHAVQTAYASNDQVWVLTAVLCMSYVKGFEEQILESLKSENPDIFYEAVCSAGNREIKAAWPCIKDLLTKEDIDKPLLIAAIDAASHINPYEAVDILSRFSNSNDEEIAEAADDALDIANMMAHHLPEDDLY